MRINNNVGALNAWRNLSGTDMAMSKNLERLSSGFRINRAADDVAGLAISENMRAQIKGLNQAVKNAQDGISLVQTAEGSLNEVHTMLQRMRELSVQAANGTLQPVDRDQIQTEMDNLAKEVTRITNATQFNSKDLINGSLQDSAIGSVTLQIGPNSDQTGNFSVGAMDAASLGISRDVLTGNIDNGDGFNLAGGTFSPEITAFSAVGRGVDATKSYRVIGGAANAYQLQSSSDGATWSNVGGTVASAIATVTVGDTTTGETIDVTSTVAATTAGTVYGQVNTAKGTIAGSLGTIGAGIDAGRYRVSYVASTQTATLQETADSGTTWKDIGAAVKFDAGKTITLGDVNTARTVEVSLRGTPPPADAQDYLTIGTSTGYVITEGPGDNILAAGASQFANTVAAVGTGLASGNYRVAYSSAGKVQLQSYDNKSTSWQAIGQEVTFTGNATGVTLGDAATKRTVQVNFGAGPLAAGDYGYIGVVNNQQHAQAASFNGKVKAEDAQASAGLNVSSVTGSQAAIKAIDMAIAKVSTQRSQLGAMQNRLEHTVNNLNVVAENLTASESRIRDVDMALEMAQFTKNQILMQAGTSMLAQANSKNQNVLTLLRG